ncbi:MAG: acyltransferase [Ignavibacteriae bacterium]|nr:acyltransferase [Ignavibacteriota bacterium]
MGRLRDIVYRSILRWRYRSVRFGARTRFIGFPIFDIAPNATVIVGDDVTFVSTPRRNMIGLTKRCSVFVGSGARLEIGARTGLSGVSIYCSKSVTIGAYVNCGGNASIWDTDFHPLEPLSRRRHDRDAIRSAPVHVGDDAFIGAHALLLKGVSVGTASIIAAGSVVTRSVPPGEVWGGNPARMIRRLD